MDADFALLGDTRAHADKTTESYMHTKCLRGGWFARPQDAQNL